MMTQVKRSFYNYIFIISSHVVMLIAGVATASLLARFLGPEEYGKYNIFILTAQALTVVAASWVLHPAAAKFASEEYFKTKSVKNTFYSELLVILVNIIILGSIIYFLRDRIGNFLGIESGFAVISILLYVMLLSLFSLMRFCFQGSLNFKIYGIMPSGRSFLFLLLLIIGIVLKDLLVLPMVIIFFIMSYLIIVGIFWIKLKKNLTIDLNWNQLKRILSFSWPMFFFAIGNFILDWVDKYFINVMISTYAVGIYAAAWMLTAQISLIPQLLYPVLLPIVAAYRAEGKQEYIRFYLTKLVPQLALFFSLFISGIILCARILIHFLYGSEYRDSVNIFILLSLGGLFMGIKYFYTPVSTVFNYIRLTGSINLASAFLCVGLNYLFITMYGIEGAACATVLSTLIAAAGVIFIINRKFNLVNFRALYCCIPILIIALVCMATKNILVVLFFMTIILITTYYFLKKYKIFYRTDVQYIEKIQMPLWLKSQIVKFYKSF